VHPRCRRELVEQAGLAETGFARQERKLARASDVGEGILEGAQRRKPTDEVRSALPDSHKWFIVRDSGRPSPGPTAPTITKSVEPTTFRELDTWLMGTGSRFPQHRQRTSRRVEGGGSVTRGLWQRFDDGYIAETLLGRQPYVVEGHDRQQVMEELLAWARGCDGWHRARNGFLEALARALADGDGPVAYDIVAAYLLAVDGRGEHLPISPALLHVWLGEFDRDHLDLRRDEEFEATRRRVQASLAAGFPSSRGK
jgi:hypothetical protein